MNYYLGIDNGGTIIKAALYSSRGEEVGVSSHETKLITPKPGFVERNMTEMWNANSMVIKELLMKTGIDPANIACIACCGHGKGLYLWGKDNQPVRNGIISTDNRAWQYPVKWAENGVSEEVFKISNQQILSCQPVSLLAWLRDNEPECMDKIKWVFECKDYIRFMLTNEAYGEITDYSGTNFVNLKTRQYDEELLKLFGLQSFAEVLPPLKNSTDICGFVSKEAALLTGLKEGTPVAGGMFDINACALAVDAVKEDRICMIAGTWSINEYIKKEPVTDGSIMMNSIFCIPEYYLIEECSPTSAGNNEWFINTLLPELKQEAKDKGQSFYEYINKMVSSIPANEFCPIFLPFLMGSNVHPNAKGCFIGISSYHTRAHLLKSVYEGIAFSHRCHFEKLLATRDVPVEVIRLAGGVANSDEWTQIFADVLQYPIETVFIEETGTLGCAMAAAVAIGEYKSLNEAAQRMTRIKRRVEPTPGNIPVYNEKYVLYQQVVGALDGVWSDLQKAMHR